MQEQGFDEMVEALCKYTKKEIATMFLGLIRDSDE